jgi:hypothetical protein
MDYRLLIDLEVVEIIQRLPRRMRDDLLTQFHRIRDFPSRYADYHEQDAVGRRVEISIYGRFEQATGLLRQATSLPLEFGHF